MGQVRHGSATTTQAVRAAIQRSQASLATLSRELGINPKTVAKWRKRATVEDLKTGPKAPHSTTLTEAEEAMVVAFRRHTLLPLDDCLYALQRWLRDLFSQLPLLQQLGREIEFEVRILRGINTKGLLPIPAGVAVQQRRVGVEMYFSPVRVELDKAQPACATIG